MFTYLDPHVREKLVAGGKLVRIGADGHTLDPQAAGSAALDILGPVPLPLSLLGREILVDWYAAVREPELSKVEALAEQLREGGQQQSFAALALSMAVNSVLIMGDPAAWSDPLIRVHSSCQTGDIFGSQRCECGPQFVAALDRIDRDDAGGMIIYMAGHEGRGIGLWAKAATYLLQDAGENTYQANRSLGLPDDSRDFSDAACLIRYFNGDKPFRLLTNNPKKTGDLRAAGLAHITPVKHVTGVNAANRGYLAAKRDWGHVLSDDDLGGKS